MKRARRPLVFLVTCEHGGNRVPPELRRWFRGHARLLTTHEAYDPGALDMARSLAAALRAPLVFATVSRLVIELNRSPTHPALYSRVLGAAPAEVRARIYERHYLPYRIEVETFVSEAVARGACVLHLSSHSFTPVLGGDVRTADIGLLYDPARPIERSLCDAWRRDLGASLPSWSVRRNYPYRGSADGLTTYLRRRFDSDAYAGIELEINQKHVRNARTMPRELKTAVCTTLVSATASARL